MTYAGWMETREIPLKPGAFGWAIDLEASRLPGGLRHGTLVKIITNIPDRPTLFVRDAERFQWDLARENVLPRLQYLHDGTWLRESSPTVVGMLYNEIRRLWAQMEEDFRALDDIAWRLRRSGGPMAEGNLLKLCEQDPRRLWAMAETRRQRFAEERKRLLSAIRQRPPAKKPGRAVSDWEESVKRARERLRELNRAERFGGDFSFNDGIQDLPY